MKILIIRFSSIGDIVLTTPVIRCLKQQLPSVVLHYCTKQSFENIINTNHYIDKYIYLQNDLNKLIDTLKKERYDYVIDLHNNVRTKIIKWKLGVKSYSYNKLNIEKWLYVNFKINLLPKVHIVDRYMATVASLGVFNDHQGLDFFIAPSVTTESSLLSIYSKYVVFAIGGQHFTKKLPPFKIAEACAKIVLPIVIIGGKEDYKAAEDVIKFCPKTDLINLTGKLSIHQSASVINKSAFVISHDTGMMHIASALKKKIFAIWGNTVPDFGMYPYKTEYENIENVNIGCRPCSKIGFNKCPKTHFKCMIDINFEQKF